MKNLSFITIVLIAFVSCKDKGDLTISADNLTECPAETNCSYIFTESADVTDNFNFKSGIYRVFKVQKRNGDRSESLFIKAPMDGKSFTLSAEEIKTRFSLRTDCAGCFILVSKPLFGTVKGVNTTPDKPADQAQWLLDINVVIGTVNTEIPVDTIRIKQYFSPNFVYN